MAKKSNIKDMLTKNPKTGIHHVHFKGKDNKNHTLTTGAKNLEDAIRIVKEAKLDDIDMASRANSLNAAAITTIMAGRNVKCDSALDEWATWQGGNASPNTVRSQRIVLVALFNQVGCHKWPINRLLFEHLDAFVNGNDETKRSNRNMRLASIKSLFKFISAKGYCVGNPSAMLRVKLKNLSHEQKEPTKRLPFTEREYRHLITHTDGFWRFACALSYWAGLRLSDVCNLEWAGIMPEEIVVWTQKSETRVALPLKNALIGNGELQPILMAMMCDHARDPKYCFPVQRAIINDPERRAGLSVAFGRILVELGIEGKSFHCLRHSFATRLGKAGVTVEEIGRFMGHGRSSGEVTAGYIH